MASAVLIENLQKNSSSSVACCLLPQLIFCDVSQLDLISVTNITKKHKHTHIEGMILTTN
ncbi:MAG: hypothetical protein F6K22_19485 [Okeania sp. SIO2F4]|uniref:hypothetical protein n=1 Tax=Okeania sp. SIO2F4 TaxID=2607790 RepID=UPI00142AB813|nr:hypothetical protein [Okeania sp. SIO2F4]NES04822.1 hypothetical protein [Okeania sp. SIO2F4]